MANDKRTRLVEAADQLFHQQGIHSTTLANIADLAKVPLGNVYYYFKSKESIIQAVLVRRQRLLRDQFEQLDQVGDIKARLQAFIETHKTQHESIAHFGDPLGSLCHELSKQDNAAIREGARELMGDILGWCEKQFSALGKDLDGAKSLASSLVARLQGIHLLTLTFKDPSLAERQTQSLAAWVQTV